MSSLDRNLNLFLIYIYRGLRAGNGRRRLDGSAYDQLGAVADTAQNPAGMVGSFIICPS